jgi:hypothetical protein
MQYDFTPDTGQDGLTGLELRTQLLNLRPSELSRPVIILPPLHERSCVASRPLLVYGAGDILVLSTRLLTITEVVRAGDALYEGAGWRRQ